MWYDMHAHLDKLEVSPEQALLNARAVGVVKIVTIGTEPADHQVVLDLAKKYYPSVYCTLGVHPHEAALFTPEVKAFIDSHLPEKEVVAVGEIGLDYYYDHADRNVQKQAFREQLEMAAKHGLPVEIHTRDAEEDTLAILGEFKGKVKGIIHCFTGTRELAFGCIDLGFNISISGVVTFKNAQSLRDTVRDLPLDRIHVETDAPFLAPIPMRGKKNEPSYVVHTAQVVADLKGITLEQLATQTRQNAHTLFTKITP
ncbi:MAG: TatD family hydrolase [Bdellovibrionota bacterium]